LIGMTGANLSVLERGLINYTQDSLERIAGALDCSVADLVTRAPQDSETFFELWRGASARQRGQMIEIGKTILKPDGSSS
jgi:transcriptional regulator with XRE-family HTH domain